MLVGHLRIVCALWDNTVQLKHLFVETAKEMGNRGAWEMSTQRPLFLAPLPKTILANNFLN